MFPDVSEDTTQHNANHRIHADDEKHILVMYLNLLLIVKMEMENEIAVCNMMAMIWANWLYGTGTDPYCIYTFDKLHYHLKMAWSP